MTPNTPKTPHREFAKRDAGFGAACNAVGLPATKRQASKYRRHMGRAWKEGRHLTSVQGRAALQQATGDNE